MSEELATFSAGITITVTPESISISTDKLSDGDPSTDDEKTCAVIAGVLARKAADYLNDVGQSLSKEEILESLRELTGA